jgi:carboxylate-amine ligase
LARALVLTALRSAGGTGPAFTPPRPELVRAARWRAARSGLADVLVDPRGAAALPAREVVRALLEHVRPALDELGDQDVVPPVWRRSCAAARRPTGSGPSATRPTPSTTSSRRPAPERRQDPGGAASGQR